MARRLNGVACYCKPRAVYTDMSEPTRLPPAVARVVTPQEDKRADGDRVEHRVEALTVRPGGRRELTLKLTEVATILRCDVRTVKKLIRTQALGAVRVSERNTRVTERELGRFLNERSVPKQP